MVIVINGKDRIRDLLSSDIYDAALGTDDTSASVSDTDLGGKVVATVATPTKTTGVTLINVTHVLPSTIGVGTTFNELGVYVNSGGTLLSRVVFPDFDQTANTELQTTEVIVIE